MSPRSAAQLVIPLVFPAWTAVFLLTTPHVPVWSIAGFLTMVLAIALDFNAGPERTQPEQAAFDRLFDATLYGAVALHVLNVALVVRAALLAGPSFDLFVGIFLCGLSSGYSAVVVAHELIHRPQTHFRLLGRLLLATVLYEHFFTEHIRGHHRRIGTEEDPATARFGEQIGPFLKRTVPGQFRSAWRLETKRLGDVDMPLWDSRMLRNRVVQGLVVQWTVVAVLFVTVGWATVAYLMQAALAVLLLECVNYIEHWGLVRTGKRVTTIDSWDTESWFTYYTLVGLSRHADHHAHAARPYQQLRHFPESPKMRYGYWGMVVMALFRNRRLVQIMSEELEHRQLGPFRQELATSAA